MKHLSCRKLIILILLILFTLSGCATSSKETVDEQISKKGMSENPEALKFYSIGNRLLLQDDNDKAIVFFMEALRIDPLFSDAWMDLGLAHAYKNEYDKAIEYFNKAIDTNPDSARAFFNRGYSYFTIKKYGEAVRDFDKAVKIKPDYQRAYKTRGSLYYKLKKTDMALKDYNKAIELKNDDQDAYFKRGLLYLNENLFEEGIDDFKKASVLDPKDFAPLYNIACIYSLKKDYLNTRLYLEKAFAKGFKEMDHLKKDPDLENFRKSDEYGIFLENIKK